MPATPAPIVSFARGGVQARPHIATTSAACVRVIREIRELERNVAMLLRRVLVALVIERGKGLHQLGARRARRDYFVDVAAFGGDIRTCKPFAELRDFLRPHRLRVL